MKTLKIIIAAVISWVIAVVVGVALVGLAGSLILWTPQGFNPGHWQPWARVALAAWAVYTAVVTVAVSLE